MRARQQVLHRNHRYTTHIRCAFRGEQRVSARHGARRDSWRRVFRLRQRPAGHGSERSDDSPGDVDRFHASRTSATSEMVIAKTRGRAAVTGLQRTDPDTQRDEIQYLLRRVGDAELARLGFRFARDDRWSRRRASVIWQRNRSGQRQRGVLGSRVEFVRRQP